MRPVRLLARRPGMCARPVEGEGEATLFCGEPTGSHRPGYCDACAALMTTGHGRSLNGGYYVQLGNVRMSRPTRDETPAPLDTTFGRH